jgi:hypothetical protein
VRDDEVAKGGGSDGVATAQALGTAERRRKSGDGSKALRSTGSTTSGAGFASYLLARLLGGFTAMKRRRSPGFDGGGGKLELGFRRLTARAKGGTGCSGRRSSGRRRP